MIAFITIKKYFSTLDWGSMRSSWQNRLPLFWQFAEKNSCRFWLKGQMPCRELGETGPETPHGRFSAFVFSSTHPTSRIRLWISACLYTLICILFMDSLTENSLMNLVCQLCVLNLCIQLRVIKLRVLEFVCQTLCTQTLCTRALNVTCIQCDVHHCVVHSMWRVFYVTCILCDVH